MSSFHLSTTGHYYTVILCNTWLSRILADYLICNLQLTITDYRSTLTNILFNMDLIYKAYTMTVNQSAIIVAMVVVVE